MIKLRGCQKRIYHIKNIGGKYFDEAYLILKNDPSQEKNGYRRLLDDIFKKDNPENDLAHEANTIVREAIECFSSPGRKKISVGKGIFFALGAASSSALIGTIALIVALSCM